MDELRMAIDYRELVPSIYFMNLGDDGRMLSIDSIDERGHFGVDIDVTGDESLVKLKIGEAIRAMEARIAKDTAHNGK